MSIDSVRNYISNLPVGGLDISTFESAESPAFDAIDINALPNGLVAGGNLLQFSDAVSAELKSSVALSLLAAQRVASNDPVVMTPDQWINRHNTVLQNLNWSLARGQNLQSNFKSLNVAVHEAIIPFLTAALGPAAAAGSLVVTALQQLSQMRKDSPWIDLFNRQSRRFNISEYQFSVVDSQPFETTMSMAAARFDASYGQTQVLFFRVTKQNAAFELASSKLSANTSLLAAMNEDLKIKMASHSKAYIKSLDVGLPAPQSGDDVEAVRYDAGAEWEMANAESVVFEAARPWRVAKSLLALRRRIDEIAPNRSRASDGTIGDAAHQSRKSDHNPWIEDGGVGVVTAMDVTHDPERGCDAEAIAESLRSNQDARLKYVIWRRRIMSSSVEPWTWRPYAGANPHEKHIHISVRAEKAAYDAEDVWSV